MYRSLLARYDMYACDVNKHQYHSFPVLKNDIKQMS